MSITKCLEFALLATSLTGNAAGKVGKVGFKTTELVSCGSKKLFNGVQAVSEYAKNGTHDCGEGGRSLEQVSQNGITKSKELLSEGSWLRGGALRAVSSLGDGIGKVGKVGFGTLELAFYGLENVSALVGSVSQGLESTSEYLKESSKSLEKNSQELGENAEELSEKIVESGENFLNAINEYQRNAYADFVKFLHRVKRSVRFKSHWE